MEIGEYNPCLDVTRYLSMVVFSNTHTFAPIPLMKNIHNMT
jgi:hypothetical protein